MGIYYTLYNLTRGQKVESYWKADPYCDCDKVAEKFGWAQSDIIVSLPDTAGDIYRIFLGDESKLVQLDGMDFYHEYRTEENAEVLDA